MYTRITINSTPMCVLSHTAPLILFSQEKLECPMEIYYHSEKVLYSAQWPRPVLARKGTPKVRIVQPMPVLTPGLANYMPKTWLLKPKSRKPIQESGKQWTAWRITLSPEPVHFRHEEQCRQTGQSYRLHHHGKPETRFLWTESERLQWCHRQEMFASCSLDCSAVYSYTRQCLLTCTIASLSTILWILQMKLDRVASRIVSRFSSRVWQTICKRRD
jgi:hypothetical protein